MSKKRWTISINEVPFESENKRNECYEKWIESFKRIVTKKQEFEVINISKNNIIKKVA
jgi:hypothetical protein